MPALLSLPAAAAAQESLASCTCWERLAVNSVDELITEITNYIEHRNQNPKPFTWTASVGSILRKVAKAKRTLASQH